MSNEAKHTPTPWRKGQQIGSYAPMIFAVAGDEIALLSNFDRSLAEAEANAAFIVRACNSHAELLEALRKAEEFMTGTIYSEEGTDWKTLLLVRAAIAKAEGIS